MRAYVQRDSATGEDAIGGKPVASWGALKTVPCFAWIKTEREPSDGNKTAVISDFRAIMPKGTDVTEIDRLEKITDRLGVTLHAGPIVIESVEEVHVGSRPSHLELMLRRVA